ncbi:hypothetical protein NSK_006428 [Nannochloropsis salina CCMP1776]|uniref:RRM domain-containing protein n=1 Tax=Nannochloropsis salina CCMP1776 TaxID=1027361 RepID=A0A4D9D0X0_9STRA|nr:hypothetical protein NSK_006428 [Nannochloropsis salina CCMP1776]|eukprot:TFJ82309.1 hypothetical protein NSK_006428 [Nannochloropsis salina CCMP1776]
MSDKGENGEPGRDGGGGAGGRGPPKIDGMTTLKIDNIRYDCTTEDLRELFKDTGEIGDVYIPRDHNSGDNRGFAFVRYHEKEDAERALEKVDGTDFKGRDLRVSVATRKRPDHSRDGGGGHRGGGRGGGRYGDDRRGGYGRGYGGGYGDRDGSHGGRDGGYGGGRDRYDDRDRRGGGYYGGGGGGYDDRRGGYSDRGGRDRYDDRGGRGYGGGYPDRRDRSRSPPRRRSRSRSPPRYD